LAGRAEGAVASAAIQDRSCSGHPRNNRRAIVLRYMSKHATDLLLRKLQAISQLPEAERAEAVSIVGIVQVVEPHKEIVEDGSSPTHSCLLVSGLAFRYKILPEGRRQILSFHIGGDILDLYSFVLRKMDHAIASITPCTIAKIQHSSLERVMDKYPHLAKVLWRDTLIDSAIYREWMINIGRRTAEQRLAHLICEMFCRMHTVGLAQEHSFTFPVTQTDIADCLGISLVHVNRVVKKLREDGLLTFERSSVVVEDWDRLFDFSEFDSTFLHTNKSENA
jgi:CRP-like cAMP-binding protein